MVQKPEPKIRELKCEKEAEAVDRLINPFPPVYDKDSRILILGTFPSTLSRKNNFYYGNPQNRFWKVLSQILGAECPQSIDEKKELLLAQGIALWDVIKSCVIKSSDDSSIREAVGNDFGGILTTSGIKAVFTNGRKAEILYRRLVLPQTGITSVCLPSTSPANCAMSLDKLVGEWSVIRKDLS